MPKIVIKSFDGETHAERKVAHVGTFAELVIQLWPHGLGSQPTIYRNGEVLDAQAACTRYVAPSDVFEIVLRPGAPLAPVFAFFATTIGATGITYGYLALTAISLIGSYLLAPKIPKPRVGYEWEEEEGPQRLSGQSNQFRPGQRVPDVFGRMRVYPDLISEPVVRWSGKSFDMDELYIVTNGDGVLFEPRVTDEPSGLLPNNEFTFYRPLNNDPFPADYPILKTDQFVGGVELPAANEKIESSPWNINTNGTITVAVDGYFESFSVGDKFMFTTYYDATDRPTAPATGNIKPFEVTSVSGDGRTINVTPQPGVTESVTFITLRRIRDVLGSASAPTLVNITNWEAAETLGFFVTEWRARYNLEPTYNNLRGWTAVRTFGSPNNTTPLSTEGFRHTGLRSGDIDNAAITYRGESWVLQWDGDDGALNPDQPGAGYASSIVSVPGEATEIWYDFTFPQGLYQQEAGDPPAPRTVQIKIFYRERSDVSPNPNPWSEETATFSAKTRTMSRYTHIVTLPVAGQYETYVQRVTPFDQNTDTSVFVDAVQWSSMRGRQDYNPDPAVPVNYTMARLKFTSQSQQVLNNNRRFNVIVNRWLPTYDENGPSPVTGYKNAIRWALAYTLVEQGGVDPANIDWTGLAEIDADLSAIQDEANEFHAIIDQTMTVDDQLAAIANAGRINVFRRGEMIYFGRTGLGELPVTLFNARNKQSPEQKTMVFGERDDPDAVIIRYLDAAAGYLEREIQYPSVSEVPTPRNPLEVTLLGVTNYGVAYRAAKFQYDQTLYLKDSISVQVGEEGLLLDPGDVFSMVDAHREEVPLEGEVLAINGDTFTFDKVIPAGTYMCHLRDQYGDTVSRFERTFTDDSTTRDFAAWNSVTMPDEYSQTGLLYSFTPISEDAQEQWTLSRYSPDADAQGSGTIEAIRYDERAYEADDPALVIPQIEESMP